MCKLHIAIAALAYVTLSGNSCTPDPSPGLVGPSARCMEPPETIPKISAGKSITDHDGENIKARKREASKTRCLQSWVRTVTAK